MLLRAVVFLLFFSIFFPSCSHPYLFISDPVFAELEKSRIQEISSPPMNFEVFSRKPSPQELVIAARERRAAALVFSPLYHDLAPGVFEENPELSVYAVVPPGYVKPEGIATVELNTLEAAEAITALLEENFPEKTPVYLTILGFPKDSWWDDMIQHLAGAEGHIRTEQITVSLDKVKQRNFGSMADTRTDVLLLLLGDYSAEIGENPPTDLRGDLPKLIISDRPVDSGGKIKTFSLTVDWKKAYQVLFNGVEEVSPWILLPGSRNEQDNPPGVNTDFISN